MAMYWLAKDGVSTGPYAEGRLADMWTRSEIGPDDLLALHGTEDWFAAGTMLPGLVEEIAEQDHRAREPKRKTATRNAVRPRKALSWGIAIVAILLGLFIHWLLGLVTLVVAIALDGKEYRCAACGNRVEKTSTVCPTCSARLLR